MVAEKSMTENIGYRLRTERETGGQTELKQYIHLFIEAGGITILVINEYCQLIFQLCLFLVFVNYFNNKILLCSDIKMLHYNKQADRQIDRFVNKSAETAK